MSKFEDETGVYSREFCMKVASKVLTMSELPVECKRHGDVVSNLQRRLTKKSTEAKAVAGLGNQATQRVSQAKIQRRLTNTRRFKGRATQK
eukprot:CAMPEP_0197465346 /NCGR_PEP_ID=MMETSP1175-20131217/64492_1 /TAXON_ID=1003142 /ORGANISM="Triceratium dubium, Strain CCMP147" /LENGTH=90 /DNA_ID=CAMNT_0043001357 /DNA_START=197 /DNA_END=469 /DNA_ORIENTATION=-